MKSAVVMSGYLARQKSWMPSAVFDTSAERELAAAAASLARALVRLARARRALAARQAQLAAAVAAGDVILPDSPP